MEYLVVAQLCTMILRLTMLHSMVFVKIFHVSTACIFGASSQVRGTFPFLS